MKERKNNTRAAVQYENTLHNRCPLCGRLIATVYPEIAPGIRYAHCQHGHKVRLQQGTHQERNAG